MLASFLSVFVIALNSPAIRTVTLNKTLNGSHGITEFSFEMDFSMNFTRTTTEVAYFEDKDVLSFSLEGSDIKMELNKRDNTTLGEIKCKFLETATEIEINACNISIVFGTNKTNLNYSVEYRFIFNKTTTYKLSGSRIHLKTVRNDDSLVEFTLHNTSLQFKYFNRTCNIDYLSNITSAFFNSTDSISFCPFDDTNLATVSLTSGSESPLIESTHTVGTTPTPGTENISSTISDTKNTSQSAHNGTSVPESTNSTAINTSDASQSSTPEMTIYASTGTTKHSTTQTVTNTNDSISIGRTLTNSAKPDTNKTIPTQTETNTTKHTSTNSAQPDTKKPSTTQTETTTTKPTSTTFFQTNTSKAGTTQTSTATTKPVSTTSVQSDTIKANTTVTHITKPTTTSTIASQDDSTKTPAALTGPHTKNTTSTTSATTNETKIRQNLTDTTTTASFSKSSATSDKATISASLTDMSKTNIPSKDSSSATSTPTQITTRVSTLTKTVTTDTMSKETGSTELSPNTFTTPALEMQKRSFSVATTVTLIIFTLMAIPTIYKAYTVLSRLKKSEEPQDDMLGHEPIS